MPLQAIDALSCTRRTVTFYVDLKVKESNKSRVTLAIHPSHPSPHRQTAVTLDVQLRLGVVVVVLVLDSEKDDGFQPQGDKKDE